MKEDEVVRSDFVRQRLWQHYAVVQLVRDDRKMEGWSYRQGNLTEFKQLGDEWGKLIL